MPKLKVYPIPVCPFRQRLEILTAFKGCADAVDFASVESTVPRLRRQTKNGAW